MSQLLRFGQVRLPTLQLLCQQFLLGDIDRGTKKPLKDFAFNNGNTYAANVALLAVGANNSSFSHRSHSVPPAFSLMVLAIKSRSVGERRPDTVQV